MIFSLNKEKLKNNIVQLNNYGEIYYPVKANSSKRMIEAINEIGEQQDIEIKYQIFNKLQLQLLEECSVKYSRIQIANTRLSSRELIEYYNIGIRSFVIDNAYELDILAKTTKLRDCEIILKIALSNYLDINVNTGADRNELSKLEQLVKKYNCKYGYSIYIQDSAKNLVNVKQIYENIINDIKGLYDASFISIGGIAAEYYNEQLVDISNNLRIKDIKLRIEPGRALVNNTESVLLSIESIRTINNVTSITLDASIHNEFIDKLILDKQFEFSEITSGDADISIKINNEQCSYQVHLYGNCSCSYDYLGTIYIPNSFKLEVGQMIKVDNIGAYFGKQ